MALKVFSSGEVLFASDLNDNFNDLDSRDIGDLDDVDTAGAADGDVLQFDGFEYVTGEPDFRSYVERVYDYGTIDSATNIDLELGPVQTVEVEDDLTLTITGQPSTAGVARSVLLLIKQDATGGRDITYSGIDVWFGEIDPTEWDADEERAITIVATSTTVRAFVVPEAV